ncbi:TetR/AcrR family transcriptional regulator [Oerskovia flava]|uniref:TetR/AcrR family transcriptional regulator n=1 Tax=Oerskovia flava TaxID=2986422 RepID=UPI002240641C|nr:TetR/AcrR family transcriptional regulator [Oerskovia sp. JB1-3-2]
MSPRARYHHGALREELLLQGRVLLAEVGPDAFSLNELARRVGVSSAAPYRHFADRDDLVDAIADEGYDLFADALTEAVTGADDAGDAVRRIGHAYLGFAAEHPAYFRLMFRGRDGRTHERGPASFETLARAIQAAQATGHLDRTAPVPVLARSIWSILHGAAVLEASGGFRKLDLDVPREQLADELLSPFLRAPRGQEPQDPAD